MRVIVVAVALTACGGGATTDGVDTSGLTLTTHVTPGDAGELSIDPDKDVYDSGEVVHVSATPADGYTFVRFSGGASSTAADVTVTMSHAVELTATFAGAEVSMRQTVTPRGRGTVTLSPLKTTYHVGDVVKLTAKAATGYSFAGWTGDVASTTSAVSITLTGDTTVEASFAKGAAGSGILLAIVNDLPGTKDGDDDWSQMNTVVRVRAGPTLEGVRDAGEGELLTNGTSSCAPGSIAVGTNRSFDVSAAAPDYFIYVQTGSWEYDPFFSGCWDLYLTQVYDCGGNCCAVKSATMQITGHVSGTKTVRLSTLLPPETWEGSPLCQ